MEYLDGSTLAMEDADFLVRDAAHDAWGRGAPSRRPHNMTDAPADDDDGDGRAGGGNDDVGPAEDVEGNRRSCHDDDDGGDGDDGDDDDGDYIGEGECELCERTVKLTRHHLVPKSTWPRMRKRLWNAAPWIE